MKKALVVLLALCLMIPTAFAQGGPLVYRVTDGEGHTLYLFGTIHVGDMNTVDLVYSVYDTLRSCDLVAMEIDPVAFQSDARAALKAMSSLYLPQGDDIANYLSEKTIKAGYETLEQPKAFLSRIAPAGWFSYAQNMIYQEAGLDSAFGADWYIAGMAYGADIPIVELETYDEQMAVLENTSLDLLDFMIYTTLTQIDAFKQNILDLTAAWSAGDAEELARLIAEEDDIPESLQAAYDAYLKAIQYDRDDAFLEDAVRLLKSGDTALFAVGAAHIFGEAGLAARLSDLGYSVEAVEPFLSAAVTDRRSASLLPR